MPTRLKIPSNIPRNSPWLKGMLETLVLAPNYADVEVERCEMPQLGRGKIARWQQGGLIQINGEYIYLDCWDFSGPTWGVLHDLDDKPELAAVIKIQMARGSEWETDTPVVPWTMFHMDQQNYLENQEKYETIISHTTTAKIHGAVKGYRIGYTGCMWRHREVWVEAIKKIPNSDVTAWPRSQRKHRPGTFMEWIHRVATWKIAIILQGKHDGRTEAKNRSEPQFASLNIPMILNYKPYYFNELTPGIHYIYCKAPEDLPECIRRAELLNPQSAFNANNWWWGNASARGIAHSFMQLMQKLGVT